ncbi:hypothetical protein LTR04_004216 [Oleoguttula sp. CCFEE 6159]|nr:hypothetical protein LTR04_004216 [Oleoguttula sp. CCFEE 6159]
MSAQNENVVPQQAVRFSSVNQEIEPASNLQDVQTLTASEHQSREDLSPEAQEELRQLSKTLQNSNIQSRRMDHYAFEPVSLPGSMPASRVPSGTQTPTRSSIPIGTLSGASSPKPSPPTSAMHSPPLTPAASKSREGKTGTTGGSAASVARLQQAPEMMTPQRSQSPQQVPYAAAQAGAKAHSSGPTSISDASGAVASYPRHTPTFSIGPTGDSLPPSHEGSPTGTPGSTTPGTATPAASYTRPFTPQGERDDPYARSKRGPQSRNVDAVEARFKFSRGAPPRSHSGLASAPQLPRSNGSGSDLKSYDNKHHSLFGGKKHDSHEDSSSSLSKPQGSKGNLKRFFKFGDHKHKEKSSQSLSGSSKSGTRTPPNQVGQTPIPFADDHGLQTKYGKFGKVLGSGAGGSVRLMKRTGDGVTFAVKQFRDRHAYESEREYNKKVTAEFCIGSTLHHGNIIETIDIVQEKGKWYEVMEYAPYDLFAIVMTGKMSREEVTCCTLQILSGVTYLHSMGLAHRDLKLDNVVVNDQGIMKIIDFGSAVVFRYPFENDIVLATGVVGSDPYLAPEVYDNSRYDPQPVDIWSLAIIFCCMTLRRFPWKAPRISDNSYRLFISPPDPDQVFGDEKRRSSHNPPKSTSDLPASAAASDDRRRSAPLSEPTSRRVPDGNTHGSEAHSDSVSRTANTSTAGSETSAPAASQQQVIKGPWRLLRLLPRDTRYIIGRMLEVDPKKRATLPEILEDKWVRDSPVCRQEEGGLVVRAPGHTHTLEPGAGDTPSQSRK